MTYRPRHLERVRVRTLETADMTPVYGHVHAHGIDGLSVVLQLDDGRRAVASLASVEPASLPAA